MDGWTNGGLQHFKIAFKTFTFSKWTFSLIAILRSNNNYLWFCDGSLIIRYFIRYKIIPATTKVSRCVNIRIIVVFSFLDENSVILLSHSISLDSLDLHENNNDFFTISIRWTTIRFGINENNVLLINLRSTVNFMI